MKKPWPWFRLYSAEYQSQTRGMKASEKGFYIDLLVMMHEWGGPIPCDASILSRATSTTPATVKTYLETLLIRGLVFRLDADQIWSPASQRELENQEERSELQRKKSSQRWEKDKQNQRQDDAAAYRYENRDIDIDSDPHKEDRKSNTSLSSKGSESTVEDKAARDGAASRPIEVNQKIPIPGLGDCFVDKIVSVKPFRFLVYSNDEDGEPRAYCVDRQLRFNEIAIDEAAELPDLSEEDANGATA